MEIAPYLDLARRLCHREVDEDEVAAAAAALPPLTDPLLDALVAEADGRGPAAPRHGWALLAVADAAAARQAERRLQARAAWELARAANRWIRPGRAQRAAERACARFEEGGEPGWVAAATWQAYALPWAHSNFPEVVAHLEAALAGLEGAGLEHLVPFCRRDLGFANLLIGRPTQALALLAAGERYFREQDLAREVGRTLTSKAAALRRDNRFDEALAVAAEAVAVLAAADNVAGLPTIDYQVARFRQAALQTLQGVAYEEAERTLLEAEAWYREADVPLLAAQCQTILQRLYLDSGRLAEAARAAAIAREAYRRFEVLGMQADNYLDSGRIAYFQGKHRRALDYYGQAQRKYKELAIPYMVAVCAMYQGDMYGVLGRYQQALALLEEAYAFFEEKEDDYRRLECALLLAKLLLALKRPAEALAHLEPVAEVVLAAGRTFFLMELHASQAEALFQQGQGEAALARLQAGVARLPEEQALPRHAYLHRLQGEILLALERPAAALAVLEGALQQQQEMALPLKAAATQLLLGECYLEQGLPEAARAAWEAVLAASREAAPELEWQARASLARLATAEGERLRAYREAVAALTRLRRWFWQPAVAGDYLQQPLALVTEAVALAARLGEAGQALAFIEEGKAQTLLRRAVLAEAAPAALALAERPRELVAEIRWLRRQIETSVAQNPGFLRPEAERRLRTQLQERLEAYKRVVEQAQRRRAQPLAEAAPLPRDFDEAAWRRQAQTALGEAWVALDYYLERECVYGILLTPSETRLFRADLDRFTARLLERWARGRPPDEEMRPADLERLSRYLLPEGLAESLTPETNLLVAPHATLHHLPWPALPLADGRLLVEAAIPSLVPSLAVAGVLWQRPGRAAGRRDGLLLALSHFEEGRYPALPEVKAEVAFLAGSLSGGGVPLLEQAATWAGLQAVAGGDGLAGQRGERPPFAFWHIATHAFHDGVSGRLSGIALYDQDLWLDDLWHLAPLPPLVMLSACSGSRGFFYPGDEQLGLPSTCLAAGARQVVGSLWPVLDPAAAALTRAFYGHYYAGADPAAALARAQREAVAAGRPLGEWASFICTGPPSSGENAEV